MVVLQRSGTTMKLHDPAAAIRAAPWDSSEHVLAVVRR